eukprot:TRINITY_DN2712_c0_g1_i8.p1 TRINITY_DN2712_c0_g1~~TRINITY_DN2712_c0_g1_i8.p1  ORF type:complete len:458 (+),score=-36.74 TRINITY_DN2712_c0_g1_i8:230-1603(+)
MTGSKNQPSKPFQFESIKQIQPKTRKQNQLNKSKTIDRVDIQSIQITKITICTTKQNDMILQAQLRQKTKQHVHKIHCQKSQHRNPPLNPNYIVACTRPSPLSLPQWYYTPVIKTYTVYQPIAVPKPDLKPKLADQIILAAIFHLQTLVEKRDQKLNFFLLLNQSGHIFYTIDSYYFYDVNIIDKMFLQICQNVLINIIEIIEQYSLLTYVKYFSQYFSQYFHKKYLLQYDKNENQLQYNQQHITSYFNLKVAYCNYFVRQYIQQVCKSQFKYLEYSHVIILSKNHTQNISDLSKQSPPKVRTYIYYIQTKYIYIFEQYHCSKSIIFFSQLCTTHPSKKESQLGKLNHNINQIILQIKFLWLKKTCYQYQKYLIQFTKLVKIQLRQIICLLCIKLTPKTHQLIVSKKQIQLFVCTKYNLLIQLSEKKSSNLQQLYQCINAIKQAHLSLCLTQFKKPY